jgi:hypothetical protein
MPTNANPMAQIILAADCREVQKCHETQKQCK